MSKSPTSTKAKRAPQIEIDVEIISEQSQPSAEGDDSDGAARRQGSDLVGQVLFKTLPKKTANDGGGTGKTQLDEEAKTALREKRKLLMQRNQSKFVPQARRQHIFEDAMGRIDPAEADDPDYDVGNKVRTYEQPKGFETQLDKVYPWNVVDHIYDQNAQEVEAHLAKMKDYIYPHASSIYYTRKVEFTNLVVDQQKKDQKKLEYLLEQSQLKEDAKKQMEKATDKLKRLMDEYDIPHQLRGDKYQDYPTMKLEFKKKILGILGAPNSYLNYKRDQVGTLDISKIRSDEYVAQENAQFFKDRTTMKYRLYGKEALTEHEWQKMIDWGVAQVARDVYGHPQMTKVRVKKKVTKKRRDKRTGKTIEVKSEKSGDGDSCYTHVDKQDYVDNEDGDPNAVNNGYEVKTLDPEMFGAKAALKSVARQSQLKTRQRQVRREEAKKAQSQQQKPSLSQNRKILVNDGKKDGQMGNHQALNKMNTNITNNKINISVESFGGVNLESHRTDSAHTREMMPQGLFSTVADRPGQRTSQNKTGIESSAQYIAYQNMMARTSATGTSMNRDSICSQNEVGAGGSHQRQQYSSMLAERTHQSPIASNSAFSNDFRLQNNTPEITYQLAFSRNSLASTVHAQSSHASPRLGREKPKTGAFKANRQEMKRVSQQSVNSHTGQRNILMPHLARKFYLQKQLAPISSNDAMRSIDEQIRSGHSRIKSEAAEPHNRDLFSARSRSPRIRAPEHLNDVQVPRKTQPHRQSWMQQDDKRQTAAGEDRSRNSLRPQLHTDAGIQQAGSHRGAFRGMQSGMQPVDYLVDKHTGQRIQLKNPSKRTDIKHMNKLRRQKFQDLVASKLQIDVVEKNLPQLSHLDEDKGMRATINYSVQEKRSAHRRQTIETARKNAQTAMASNRRAPRLAVGEDDGDGQYRNIYKSHRPAHRQLKSNMERRKLGDGRFNKIFSPQTPTVFDPAIRELLKKYPVDPLKAEEDGGADNANQHGSNQDALARNSVSTIYADRYRKIQGLDKDERNKRIQKDIEMLARHVDFINMQSKQDIKDHVNQLVRQDFRNAEMNKVTEIFKEIDFAEPVAINGLFQYHQTDDRQKLGAQVEVTKEYKEGKLDPNKFVRTKKKKN